MDVGNVENMWTSGYIATVPGVGVGGRLAGRKETSGVVGLAVSHLKQMNCAILEINNK